MRNQQSRKKKVKRERPKYQMKAKMRVRKALKENEKINKEENINDRYRYIQHSKESRAKHYKK